MNPITIYTLAYISLLIFGALILRRLVPQDYREHGKLSPWVACIQAILFFVYGGFPALYLPIDWPVVSVPRWAHITGATLLFGGLAGILLGMFLLGVARSLGRGEPRLAVKGLYALSRNPQAITCGIYVVGFLVLWPSWYAAGWALLYLPLIHWMVLAEETHLERQYGREYQDYCEQVPRYFRFGRRNTPDPLKPPVI